MQRQEVAIDGHTEKVNETRYLSLPLFLYVEYQRFEGKGKTDGEKVAKGETRGSMDWIERLDGEIERDREREEKRRAADDNGEENFRRVRRWHKSE